MGGGQHGHGPPGERCQYWNHEPWIWRIHAVSDQFGLAVWFKSVRFSNEQLRRWCESDRLARGLGIAGGQPRDINNRATEFWRLGNHHLEPSLALPAPLLCRQPDRTVEPAERNQPLYVHSDSSPEVFQDHRTIR